MLPHVPMPHAKGIRCEHHGQAQFKEMENIVSELKFPPAESAPILQLPSLDPPSETGIQPSLKSSPNNN
jgi:hypothetical protein